MDRKIEALRDNGPNLSSELLSDTPSKHMQKIRLNGRVAPRLLSCRGPIDFEGEFTWLYGATERDLKDEEYRQAYAVIDVQVVFGEILEANETI